MTLNRTFCRIRLVTGRIRDIGQTFYSLILVTARIRDIGQNVLQSLSSSPVAATFSSLTQSSRRFFFVTNINIPALITNYNTY